MSFASVTQYLKSKERKYPRLISFLRKNAGMVRGPQQTYPKLMANEQRAVAEVLRTSSWNMNYGGRLVHQQLEEEFASYVGTRYGIAVNTGGMAIQMTLRALGVKPGDEVIHQVDTCVADAFAVMAAGGTPILADIGKDDFMLSEETEELITPNTKVIVPIHMWGNPEDMDWVSKLADKHNLAVVEDACLALGAEWKGKRVGSLSKAGVFSLGCLKPIQAGEGGMIVTDDEGLAQELRTIRNWGDKTLETGVRDHSTLSWNGRMSEIVAAVALEQIRGYPAYFRKLQELVAVFLEYLKRVDGIEIVVPPTPTRKPSYTQVVVRLDPKVLNIGKQQLMDRLRAKGIGVWHANFEPMNTLSFFRNGNWKEWLLKGDVGRIEKNYEGAFLNAQEVYVNLGMSFTKENFLSTKSVNSLIQQLDVLLTTKAASSKTSLR